jgi:ADP-ribosylglycohydrolase
MNPIQNALLGLAVGDALGVPVEFRSRAAMKNDPVTGMRAFGTHRQPAGTWSDDSSLAFCLAAGLCEGYNLEDIGKRFVMWYDDAYWTAHGAVFDIGITTRNAINRLRLGQRADFCGDFDEHANGNGSLMRIMPLLFYIKDKPQKERWEITRDVSRITHGHIRSCICCFFYLEFAGKLLAGKKADEALAETRAEVKKFLVDNHFAAREIELLQFVFESDISKMPENVISGSGYVLHTLEASLWCLLTTNSYKDAVLKAVNLGEDTNTTGAVTGALAGLYYGAETIPAEWLEVLARREAIEQLGNDLALKMAIG